MTEAPARQPTDWKAAAMRKRIARRYAAETRFRWMGLGAILLSGGFLAFLLASMLMSGVGGFMRTQVNLPVDFPSLGLQIDQASLASPSARTIMATVDIEGATTRAATAAFGDQGPAIISDTAWRTVREAILADPAILKTKATIAVPIEQKLGAATADGSDPALAAQYRDLADKGIVTRGFSTHFLTASNATDAAEVGIWAALKGSFLTMLVTLGLSFIVGVCAAFYLEEYAPRNRWTDLIEVSINNLAAVPSIIFGLLGLAVFINFVGLPRSAPLVGGMTLALMVMPTIVIATRNAIKAVPPSIRDAALGIGASPIQVVFHHVFPLALPGIMTGTIIAMSRALGETAPGLLIGMRIFSATPPESFTSPATLLPVQIFLWSDEIGRGFVEKTSAAIIVLLIFLLAMNGIAIYLRNRFEQRW
jgi:phosphate transport system permease protein